MRYIMLFLMIVGCVGSAHAAVVPPVSAFAADAEFSLATLSPVGDRMAYYMDTPDRSLIIVRHIDGSSEPWSIELKDMTPLSIRWVGNTHIIVVIQQMERFASRRGNAQLLPVRRAIAINLKTGKAIRLLENTRKQLTMGNLGRANRNMGRIVGVKHDTKTVLIPARTENRSLDLIEVSVEKGTIIKAHSGLQRTSNWVVDSNGTPIARDNNLQKPSRVSIEVNDGGGWKTAMQLPTDFHPARLLGLAANGTDILAALERADDSTIKYTTINGTANTPQLSVDGYDMRDPIFDPYSNLIVGAQYVKNHTETVFFDPQLQAVYAKLQTSFAGKSVEIKSWNRDRTVYIVTMNPLGKPDTYFLYRPADKRFSSISHARPALAKAAIGDVQLFPYTTRSGTPIDGYLTLPTNKKNNLPLVVVLHDSSNTRASMDYHWMAQMLAANGYAVLQSNHSGSAGYGRAFRTAGFGKWGTTIREDIEDGINTLADKGIINSKKVCIFGSGYGGFSALINVALSPQAYACVAAFAPLTDPEKHLTNIRRQAGAQSSFAENMEQIFRGPNRTVELDSISPIANAANITIPVLLLHNVDDLRMPITESRALEGKLKGKNNKVTLIEIEGSDHNLSYADTRVEVGKALLKFLKKSNVK